MAEIKSPLRYPGGKAKAVRFLVGFIPKFSEYREPFVGGGSMALHLQQHFPQASYWINDLNYDLYCFWRSAQRENAALVREVQTIKAATTDGRGLFRSLTEQWNMSQASEFDRAVRFFVLNRITFSGTVDSGGYSQKAFENRFTESATTRLAALATVLETFKITNLDYADVVQCGGENVFMFLDPPYLSATASRLYGRRGALHTGFDHERFAFTMRDCPHKWLLTYDDCAEIKKNFSFAQITAWQFQYGMNNYKQIGAAKGNELAITNYAATTTENTHDAALMLF